MDPSACIRPRRGLTFILASLGLTLAPATAFAHPLLDQAQEKFQQAEFEAALALYAQAEEANDLTRDDLVELYLRRALVHHALGNEDELDLDLFRLATIAPDTDLGRQIPPRVRDAFDAAVRETGGALSVEVRTEPAGAVVRLSTRVERDQAALVREVRLGARAPGGEWQTAVNDELVVTPGPEGRVEYWAAAIGPGGAAIAASGTETEPRIYTAGGGATEPDPVPEVEDDEGGVPFWPFALGGAVLIGGAVVAILLLGGSNENTDVNGPVVRGLSW